MRAKLHLVLSISIFFIVFSGWSQDNYWKPAANQSVVHTGKLLVKTNNYTLNAQKFGAVLKEANNKRQLVYLPIAGLGTKSFMVKEASVLHPSLAAQFPEIKSYQAVSADKKYTAKISFTPKGADITILDNSNGKTQIVALDKNTGTYKSYERNLVPKAFGAFVCKTPESSPKQSAYQDIPRNLVQDQTLRKFRIAVSATGEYTDHHGGTVADALAAINATITRVNTVFERDLAITLEVIPNTTDVIYTNADTDPYNGSLNAEVQETLTTIIGSENYDVGHLFHDANPSGNAGSIGAVCNDSRKGSAFSASFEPEGDRFDLDYVAHELGHQFGANHTWSFESEGTGVQVEPASGTTIMAYAGIVEGDNVAAFGSDYFHHASIAQITNFVAGLSCQQTVSISNTAPTIAAQENYIIPRNTPFKLEATATDAEVDNLTYAWEQIDNGVVTTQSFGPENTSGANFRSVAPSANNYRYFPRITRILANQLTQTLPTVDSVWETLSSVERDLNFAVTVRDNNPLGGQVATDSVNVKVVNTPSAFEVVSQRTRVVYNAGSVQEVRWQVAETNLAPINTEFVDIFLSTDGGFNFDLVLAENLPNTGVAKVQLPSTNTEMARIMVKGKGNIFFSVNTANFTIASSPIVLKTEELTYEVCKPSTLTILFILELNDGFAETVNFSADLPSGITAVFTPDNSNVDGTSVTVELNIISSIPVGIYDVELIGTASSNATSVPLSLNVLDDALDDVTPESPADGAINIGLEPILTWADNDNHSFYEVEIATDNAFANVVYTRTVNTNSVNVERLSAETTYFWRVRPNNSCAAGTFNSGSSFTTTVVNCDAFDAPWLPLDISPETASVVESKITFFQDAPIADLNVNLELSHTYLEDLIISLTSPAGTKVFLVSKNCGNLNNIVATFDDDGETLVCGNNPAVSGIVKPLGTLASFNGESLLGEWVLRIEDTASSDGGQLEAFSIDACIEGIFRPDEDGDGVFDDGDDLCLGTPKGALVDANGCAINTFEASNFSIEINSESCRSNEDGSINVVVQNTSLLYTATLSGNSGETQLEFTENIVFSNLSSGTYQLCLTATDGVLNYRETCFDVVISEPQSLEILNQTLTEDGFLSLALSGSEFYNIEIDGVTYQTQQHIFEKQLGVGVHNLKVSSSLACQGVYERILVVAGNPTLMENPVINTARILLDWPEDTVHVRVFGMDGSLLWSGKQTVAANQFQVPVSNLASGFYLLQIQGEVKTETIKLIKR